MPNAPVLDLTFHSRAPGADYEVFQRYLKWREEVYGPLLIRVPEVKQLDNNEIVKTSLEYPHYGSILHWDNLHARENFFKTTESKAIVDELAIWVKRGVREPIWSVSYELMKSFRSESSSPVSKPDTRIENAPVMSLEAFRLSPEEEEKYFNWFNEFGCSSFVPLFVRLPGLKGYDWYKDTNLRRTPDAVREHEYSKYLSIIYFENIQAFDNFVESPELAAFLKMMGSVFPHGLNYKWYV